VENDYAILKVLLVDTVPAYEFSKLTSLVNDLYDTFLWVEEVNKSGTAPHVFNPNEEERLYIKKADIGTPNLMEFIGIAGHLINAVNFLAENYNELLTIENATLLTVEKTNTIVDFMNKVKFGFREKSSKKNVLCKEELTKMNRSLEEELIRLKNANKLDKESEEEKNDFVSYVKNIGHVSENIIINANFTIIKSE
jgi:hypothetical protein